MSFKMITAFGSRKGQTGVCLLAAVRPFSCECFTLVFWLFQDCRAFSSPGSGGSESQHRWGCEQEAIVHWTAGEGGGTGLRATARQAPIGEERWGGRMVGNRSYLFSLMPGQW